jgi:putative nucleotidyltransferase with HDIG domain
MAAALVFGPAAGTVTVAIDSLVISLRLAARRPLPPRRLLYNLTAPPLAMWCAAHVFLWLSGPSGFAAGALSVGRLIGPLAIFAAVFFILNTGLVAIAIAFEQQTRPLRIWREYFASLWLTYFGGAAVAAQLIVLMRNGQADFLVLLLLAPIPLIIYATFRHAVGRMEDRVSHLDQVNGMYLSTIETLAQAIDAKDQVTHGHIRRVQQYALQLAHALGIKDESQLRALEAASLLHDVGKLAVPEHILNKPSTLTPTEFEKMKRHANIGADILSSIQFPYPVVPIVRHHHENWDGSGYPAGLARDAIPMGARILAVVDCFDALTSDRPYRSRLADEEAIRVLKARSGTMYDPRVVKKFVEIYATVPPSPEIAVPSEVLSDIKRTAQQDTLRSLAGPHDMETLATLFELGTQAATAANPGEALARIHPTVQRLMPADIMTLYLYSSEGDHLVATYVSGAHEQAIQGMTIPLGQRLTGWVAANRQTIVNSDAALDLGNVALKLDPTPVACLSSAMCHGSDLIGVLTIYSTRRQPFTQTHVPIVEVIAGGLTNLLAPGLPRHVPKPPATRSLEVPSGTRIH